MPYSRRKTRENNNDGPASALDDSDILGSPHNDTGARSASGPGASDDVFQGVIGATTTFVVVRPLPSFAEYDGGGPLVEALGPEIAVALEARLRDCVAGEQTRIENRRDDFYLDPGHARGAG